MSRALLALLFLLPAGLAAQARKSAFFFEFGGAGGYGSANLELGLSQRLRVRGGAGLMWIWPTFPVTASVLVGHGAHLLEVGGGATFIVTPDEGSGEDTPPNDFIEHIFFAEGQGTLTMATGIVGYRWQPAHGAMLRAVVTPLYYDETVQFWGGLSLGFSF